jgi:hypothetical protein
MQQGYDDFNFTQLQEFERQTVRRIIINGLAKMQAASSIRLIFSKNMSILYPDFVPDICISLQSAVIIGSSGFPPPIDQLTGLT